MSVLLLTMGPQLGITADLPVVGVGGAGVIRFRPIGASGPVKWTLVDSTLPAEWDSALNPDGNAATLTTSDAETAGTFSVTVRAVDSARIPVVRSFDVRVMALPLTISGGFPEWEVGAPATGALTISGGTPPYSGLAVISGALPAGVSLSIVGNQIVASGSPTVAGHWSATVQVSDSSSVTAQTSVGGAITVVPDPYWEHVVALLHFDGPDGSTTFTDKTGKVWTPSGNAQIDTAQSKFGGASGLFDGTGDYVSAAHSNDFNLSGLFCIEAWIRPGTVSKQMSVVSHRPPNGLYGFMFQLTADGKLGLQYSNGSASWVNFAGATTLSVDTWAHVAASFDGTTLRLFVNGTLDGSTESFSGTRADTSTPALIGRDRAENTTRDWQGHIDELRITKGVARYTANFTPPDRAFPDQ